MAITKGTKKNIAICLNKALLINFSSVPIFLNILNLSLFSVASLNSFKASIAALLIKKIIPRYKPIKVTKAPNPTLPSYIEIFVLALSVEPIFVKAALLLNSKSSISSFPASLSAL